MRQEDLFPGDLFVYGTGRTRRVVLIADVMANGQVHVYLTTNETEWATPVDLVLPPGLTNAPYALMVHGRVHGPLLNGGLGTRVGEISNWWLDRFLDFVWGEHVPVLDPFRGRPYNRHVPEVEAWERNEVAQWRALEPAPLKPW